MVAAVGLQPDQIWYTVCAKYTQLGNFQFVYNRLSRWGERDARGDKGNSTPFATQLRELRLCEDS